MSRLPYIVAALLLATAAQATPLHVVNGRLVGSDTNGSGPSDAALAWERTGSSWSLANGDELTIKVRLDVYGAMSPYFCDLTIRQWPDAIRVDVTVTSTNDGTPLCWSIDADKYADIADMALPFGGYLSDVLARFACDAPPVDVDRLKAQLATDVAPASAETLAQVERLGHDDWRVRESATGELVRNLGAYAQLRGIGKDLSPEQQTRIRSILTPRDVPDGVMELVQ